MTSMLKRILTLTLLSAGLLTANAIRTADLRCEMLKNPWGVDRTDPGLSWKINPDENGLRQTAYQILAASSPQLLTEQSADLWNTGRVEGSQCLWIRYAGRKLDSRSVVYWKVRVWDHHGNASNWSYTARFSVGLLKEGDWHGRYIGTHLQDTTASPQLWKKFNVQGKPEKAFLHINTLGYHEVYLNGRKVGQNVLAPAVVQFAKRSLSMTYDVTPLLQNGRNDIVIWTSKGWFDSHGRGISAGGPYVRAQIDQLDGRQWKTLVGTDDSWKARRSGYYMPGNWEHVDFQGENIVASELLPDLTAASLDAADWEQTYMPSLPKRITSPMMSEPNKIQAQFRPQAIRRYNADTWLIDMGRSIVGWTDMRLGRLAKGQKVSLTYGDQLDVEGNFDNHKFTDTYIASGKGQESFCNKFNYHAFRYIKVTGLDRMPSYDDVTAYLIYTGYDTRSSFVCSDKDMNDIHDMVHRTFPCLTLGGYMVDCPHLERKGYGGDGNASILSAQIMYDLYPLYNNWIQAYGDAQWEDGGLPHEAPNPTRCGGGPFWCAFIANAPWQTYVQYGDKDMLSRYYPHMQKYLQYAESFMPDGLLTLENRWPNTVYRHWYLGDWALPNEEHQLHPESIDDVNSCSMSWVYDTMAKVAKVLGKSKDQQAYEKKRDEINRRIHSTYFNAGDNTYANKLQLDFCFPLFVGATPQELRPQVEQALKETTATLWNNHLFTGLVGIPIVTQWLTRAGEAQFMYDMLKKRDFPGYLYMIDNQATTTWEHWNARRSRIHNCYNGIGSWFYQALGGIVYDEDAPAYSHFFIKPQPVDGVDFVKVSQPTPYGAIRLEWNKTATTFDIKVNIPVGATATVEVPFQAVSAEIPPTKLIRYGLVYNEQQRDKSTEVQPERKDPTKPITLESGYYRIVYKLK